MLLVYKIHSINFLFFWFLSFFFKIVAYEINPFLGRFRSKRIKLLEWDKYFSADKVICLRSEALKEWEKILPQFPIKSWQLSYEGRLIDFSKKAKQEIGACFEHLFLFGEIQKKHGTKSRLYIINSIGFHYLSNKIRKGIFLYQTSPVISRINVACDAVSNYFNLAASITALFLLTVRTSMKKSLPGKKIMTPVKYLWDAVSPYEMHLSSEKRSFCWIIDGNYITNKDVVFLMPMVDEKVMQEITSSPYQAFTISSLYMFIPKDIIWKCLKNLFALAPGLFIFSLLKYENMVKSHYTCSILLYKPLVLYLKPACYITSMSNTGSEIPAIEYFNVMNIRTIMYAYSANVYLPINSSYKTDFKAIFIANAMSCCMVVWHEQFKKYVEEHPQGGLDVKVIGPLMSGNEKVCQEEKSWRSIYIAERNKKGKDLKNITVFDEATATKPWNRQNNTHDLYPNLYNDEYCTAFMKDMVRLLDDFDNILLLFKPQRSLTKKKFSYSPEFREIEGSIRNNERGIILADDINPWIPVALSDMCIGIPFTSPVMAAWHYGKPALFHDPSGIARQHRYHAVSEYITHGYEELRAKVKELLSSSNEAAGNKDLWFPAKAGFAGSRPGTNSSDEFRKYLNTLSHPDI